MSEEQSTEQPLSWLSPGHRLLETCPGCGESGLSKTGLDRLAYVFITCYCGEPDYAHLAEQLWHRVHLSESAIPVSATARREAIADAIDVINRAIRTGEAGAPPRQRLTYGGGVRRARALLNDLLGKAMEAETRATERSEVEAL